MNTALHWLHGTFFHAWHFVYGQIQLTNWVGNIVAGVVTFIVLTIVWPKFRKVVTRAIGVTSLHDKLDAQHRERLEQAAKHHQAAILLAKSHHEAHMKALEDKPAPANPVVLKVSTTPSPRKAASTVKKASPSPRKATK